MRSRRLLLVLARNEAQLSEWRFLLETHGYRVLGALSLAEALQELEWACGCTLALTFAPDRGAIAELSRTRCMDGWLRVMLADVSAAEAFGTDATAVLPRQPGIHAQVLDRIRTLLARKRGPKPVAPEREQAPSPVREQAAVQGYAA